MTLIKCKECEREYSSDINKCPNCGKENITMLGCFVLICNTISSALKVVSGLILLYLIYSCYFSIGNSKENNDDVVKAVYSHLQEEEFSEEEVENANLFWGNLTLDDLRNAQSKGLILNSKNGHGENILMKVCKYTSNKNIVQFLVYNGLNVNDKDYSGNTALISSIRNQNTQIMNELIELGADINIQNSDGLTAFSIILSRLLFEDNVDNLLEKINLLLQHKAKLDIKNKRGKSPIDTMTTLKGLNPVLYKEIQQLIKNNNYKL